MLSLVRQHDSPLSPEKLFRLEFSSEHDADMPIVPIVAQTLMYLWGVRSSGKTVTLITTRATLESKIPLFRETRTRTRNELIRFMNRQKGNIDRKQKLYFLFVKFTIMVVNVNIT